MKGKSGRHESRPFTQASSLTNSKHQGLVITHLGKGLAVESSEGEIVLCHTRRRLGDVAVGDRVLWISCEGDQGRVEEILPRSSLLTRPGYAGRTRCVAANLDQVFIVVAPAPEPDWLLVDQYLAVCERRGIAAALLSNKSDRNEPETDVLASLLDYRQIDYAIYRVSAHTGQGLAELKRALRGHCSMLAGQSGVGKSSLTNALLPDKNLATSALSEKSGLGRHTTTTATLYHLPDGGDLIDSPGVAVFGLADTSGSDLAAGYREFKPLIARCQFNDCRHVNDKGCAVREAVESGQISRARYQRYLRLLNKLAASS